MIKGIFFKNKVEGQPIPQPTTTVIHIDPDPADLNIDTAYKTRWIWYHTILALELLMVNITLIAILATIAVKL